MTKDRFRSLAFIGFAFIILFISLVAGSWLVAMYLVFGFFLGACGATVVFLTDEQFFPPDRPVGGRMED